MKLTVSGATSKKEFEIVWIEANTLDGNFVIQSDHAPTTLVLDKNKELIYCFKTGKQETLTLQNGGILEVKQNSVIILLG